MLDAAPLVSSLPALVISALSVTRALLAVFLFLFFIHCTLSYMCPHIGRLLLAFAPNTPWVRRSTLEFEKNARDEEKDMVRGRKAREWGTTVAVGLLWAVAVWDGAGGGTVVWDWELARKFGNYGGGVLNQWWVVMGVLRGIAWVVERFVGRSGSSAGGYQA